MVDKRHIPRVLDPVIRNRLDKLAPAINYEQRTCARRRRDPSLVGALPTTTKPALKYPARRKPKSRSALKNKLADPLAERARWLIRPLQIALAIEI